jgi:acetyltransferase-like isoleucine patch superfamily enzyme
MNTFMTSFFSSCCHQTKKPEGTIELGDYSYRSSDCKVKCWSESCIVKVGKYCSLAKCTFVYDGNHNPTFATTFPFLELKYSEDAPANSLKKYPPFIGHDVWIGDDATIYSGVTIGNGAVVAGQSVVTKNVPPYAVVAGNPAKIVKFRFSEETIDKLQRLQWWHLPHDFITKELAPSINDIDEFIKKAEIYREKHGIAL